MVERDYFRMISDEEASQYKFDFCKNCPFYECELVDEYTQFRKNHAQDHKEQAPLITDDGRRVGTILGVWSEEQYNELATDLGSADAHSHSAIFDEDILSYDQTRMKDVCIMNRSVYQVECGRKTVTEGIGDHYKIEITEKKNYYSSGKKIIKEGTDDRWEPLQPVFISAQTGQGKNYFIENTLIPYVRELNYKEKTSYKILILSNRLALKQQIKNRIENGNNDLDDKENSEEGKIYSYKEVADVMTYQSLLHYKRNLKKKPDKYIFVICDEAHFFTSDAMFNPHTYQILETIVQLFQKAVRVYMSATPYECLEYIIKCEDEERERLNIKKHGWNQSKYKYGTMVFYHFERDYSYLDTKTYSSISELYDEIVESVVRRKEKWLIFIDDKEKCVKEKDKLGKLIKDKESSSVEDKKSKKKDEKDVEADKDNKAEKKVEKVYVVDAESKEESIYQEIVKNERLNKDTYVLISTSVLDNGVNLTGIKNIVVSDMEKCKCLQMVGRARRSKDDERKTLYMKRFCADEVDKRIKNLMRQQDAYHKYELAYDENGNACRTGVYQFFNKYYSGKEADWRDAIHWFGISYEETQWYLNEIAKSLVEKLIPKYQYIFDEMEEEKNEQQNQESENRMGQKYLEYQLSWFGKKYCADNDITFVDKKKAKKEFIDFLESYAKSGEHIEDRREGSPFRKKFTDLSDAAFGRKERDKKRIYGKKNMNSILKEESINYKVDNPIGYWIVERCNWEMEDSE